MNIKILQDNTKKVQFTTSMRSFFKWINEVNKHIHENINVDGSLYLCEKTSRDIKAYNIVLGIMEAVGAFNFKMIGGANSQIYIYLNQKLSLEKISKAPHEYKNKILEMVLQRHKISVLMMKYIFEENLASNEIWNLLEDYFVGKIPNKIVEEMNK